MGQVFLDCSSYLEGLKKEKKEYFLSISSIPVFKEYSYLKATLHMKHRPQHPDAKYVRKSVDSCKKRSNIVNSFQIKMLPKHVKAPKKGPVILDEYKRNVSIEGRAKLKSNVRHMVDILSMSPFLRLG